MSRHPRPGGRRVARAAVQRKAALRPRIEAESFPHHKHTPEELHALRRTSPAKAARWSTQITRAITYQDHDPLRRDD